MTQKWLLTTWGGEFGHLVASAARRLGHDVQLAARPFDIDEDIDGLEVRRWLGSQGKFDRVIVCSGLEPGAQRVSLCPSEVKQRFALSSLLAEVFANGALAHHNSVLVAYTATDGATTLREQAHIRAAGLAQDELIQQVELAAPGRGLSVRVGVHPEGRVGAAKSLVDITSQDHWETSRISLGTQRGDRIWERAKGLKSPATNRWSHLSGEHRMVPAGV